MADIDKSSLEEFNHNAVWRELRDQLRERRSALYETILSKHSDLPEVVEIILINTFLSHSAEVRDRLKEESNARS